MQRGLFAIPGQITKKENKYMAGQKPGGHHNPVGRRAWYERLLQEDKIEQAKERFELMEKNINKAEKYLSWQKDLDRKVIVSEEFMKFFGLK